MVCCWPQKTNWSRKIVRGHISNTVVPRELKLACRDSAPQINPSRQLSVEIWDVGCCRNVNDWSICPGPHHIWNMAYLCHKLTVPWGQILKLTFEVNSCMFRFLRGNKHDASNTNIVPISPLTYAKGIIYETIHFLKDIIFNNNDFGRLNYCVLTWNHNLQHSDWEISIGLYILLC